ncbi:hypothetical protein QBC33DRAFT_518144 [Phialemonium atrogriseum]|uniref:Uncharacterized protein n=1 Tax=Phialemonium atrogriseum TaxID=1093897 RepID=A0AAJ0BV57_9PEZI|nr:uncharacterized protein QBC33DRAFT_518144 [Phialemonium atrogriseum]KAK1763968.1 hypothetical protein QBC33DRAFT_518144 [Phialemonium atrogriseum]
MCTAALDHCPSCCSDHGSVYTRHCVVFYELTPNAYVSVSHPIGGMIPRRRRKQCEDCRQRAERTERRNERLKKWHLASLFQFESRQPRCPDCPACQGHDEARQPEGAVPSHYFQLRRGPMASTYMVVAMARARRQSRPRKGARELASGIVLQRYDGERVLVMLDMEPRVQDSVKFYMVDIEIEPLQDRSLNETGREAYVYASIKQRGG